MKYLLLTFCFLLLIPRVTVCQFDAKITGVDFTMENNRIVVTYSITNYLPRQVFNISLKFITEDNRTIIPKSVFGDIGPGIPGGVNKSIVWNFENELLEFQGTLKAVVSVVVPVAAVPDWSKVFPEKKKERGMGGPGYVGLSMIFPGLGGYFVEKNTSRAIAYNVLAASVMASIIVHNVKLQDFEDQYSAASSTQKPLIQPEIDKTEETLQKAYIAYGVIWISDIIWVTYRGFKNQKTRALGYKDYSENRIIINYWNNQFTAGYRLNF
jgi:hypothetical protein